MWPSEPEKPYLRLIVNPVTSPIVYHLFRAGLFTRTAFGLAFHDPGKTMTDDILAGFTRGNFATRGRWQRLRRMFRWQLDKEHNRLTVEAVPAMRRFDRPVGLLWGRQDENFGPAVAERLLADIPGATHIVWFENSGHMPMLEESDAYAREVIRFLTGERARARRN
jgi:pimeloyl-ACP methyl ester carboxylesterase